MKRCTAGVLCYFSSTYDCQHLAQLFAHYCACVHNSTRWYWTPVVKSCPSCQMALSRRFESRHREQTIQLSFTVFSWIDVLLGLLQAKPHILKAGGSCWSLAAVKGWVTLIRSREVWWTVPCLPLECSRARWERWKINPKKKYFSFCYISHWKNDSNQLRLCLLRHTGNNCNIIIKHAVINTRFGWSTGLLIFFIS